MSWVRLDDHFPTHPKMVAAGHEAAWLHVCALCYCAEHLTDGRVPKAMVPRLSDCRNPRRLADRLVEVNAWEVDGDEFVLHDFLEFNPSREQVLLERAAAKERRQRGARTSHESRASVDGTSGERRANDICPDPSPPDVPTERLGAPARSKGSRIPDEFVVTEEMQRWAIAECPDIDWRIHTKRFVAYWKGESGARAAKSNWTQAWRTWLLKEQAQEKRRGPARAHL